VASKLKHTAANLVQYPSQSASNISRWQDEPVLCCALFKSNEARWR